MKKELELCINRLYEEEQIMEKYFNLSIPTNKQKVAAATVIKDFSNMPLGFCGPVIRSKNSKSILENELKIVLDDFQDFKDDELLREVCSIIKNIKYADAGHSFDSGFNLAVDFVKSGARYAKKSLVLFLPSVITEASHYFIEYEIARSLKDRNSDECKNVFTTSETVPLLAAMIIAYKTKNERKLKLLFSKLKDNILGYIDLYNKINSIKCNDETFMNKVDICSQAISGYLTSFYYSLALFGVYKFCHEVILEGVAAVLKCEITTDDLIETIAQALNISSFDGLYKNGCKEFKLLLN